MVLIEKMRGVYTSDTLKKLNKWHDIRPYITVGYRANYKSIKEMAVTLIKMHNETFNIWTHFLSFLYVVYYLILLSTDKLEVF